MSNYNYRSGYQKDGGSFQNRYNNNGRHFSYAGNAPDYAYQHNNGQRGDLRKKHSGASKGTDKNGKQYFRGWNYSRSRGMITVFVSAYSKSGEHTSAKSGVTYTNLLAKVVYKNSGVEKLMGALMSHTTGKITIPELGMTLNPNAPNGGYFGKFTKKK